MRIRPFLWSAIMRYPANGPADTGCGDGLDVPDGAAVAGVAGVGVDAGLDAAGEAASGADGVAEAPPIATAAMGPGRPAFSSSRTAPIAAIKPPASTSRVGGAGCQRGRPGPIEEGRCAIG